MKELNEKRCLTGENIFIIILEKIMWTYNFVALGLFEFNCALRRKTIIIFQCICCQFFFCVLQVCLIHVICWGKSVTSLWSLLLPNSSFWFASISKFDKCHPGLMCPGFQQYWHKQYHNSGSNKSTPNTLSNENSCDNYGFFHSFFFNWS